jgi:leucine dehydrogenase
MAQGVVGPVRATALDLARELGHEEVLFVQERGSGLRVVIAIHDTTLGPAVGGTRMRLYPSLDDAAVDAVRLARGMTYKAALAGVSRGGGKAVILADPTCEKTPALLAAYARVIERMGGRFYTGGDMGIDGRDVAFMQGYTKHMSHTGADTGVDTADLAALGVFESIRAAATVLGRATSGLHVAVQGLGQVGYRLARQLHEAGAVLTVADVDRGRVEQAVRELGATAVPPDGIYDVEADVFSPNAAGSILNDDTIPRLRCRAVVGGANEQLAEPHHGDRLQARGIVYGPDYLVNAGGLLSLLYETGEVDLAGVTGRVRAIGGTLGEVLARSCRDALSPHRVADRMVEERLAAARAARAEP